MAGVRKKKIHVRERARSSSKSMWAQQRAQRTILEKNVRLCVIVSSQTHSAQRKQKVSPSSSSLQCLFMNLSFLLNAKSSNIAYLSSFEFWVFNLLRKIKKEKRSCRTHREQRQPERCASNTLKGNFKCRQQLARPQYSSFHISDFCDSNAHLNTIRLLSSHSISRIANKYIKSCMQVVCASLPFEWYERYTIRKHGRHSLGCSQTIFAKR